MSGCGCNDTASALSANTDRARRRVLWIVLVINVVLFVGEFGVGWWADSSALQADSLDSLGDASVYVLSLMVIGGTLRQRTKAVFLKGGIQALFGLGVLMEVARSAWLGAEPRASYMAVAAAVALVGNLTCFVLLTRFRSDDMNMRSVWLCSRNDLVNNVGVIIAAVLVAWSQSPWPDLLVGTLVAMLFLRTAWTVLAQGWVDWNRVEIPVATACAATRVPAKREIP
ncbi:Cation diffusion facilitator family transporter [Lysobacter dokdonensis DS-58]|uniref:Cation diffusion facilitator family transporter n=1 Tax=Lysobacter dokdonensis DS-58 TaxID=1300345 RepID=A0A0A2WI01_9GAMM|nr:cation transporter [Lysobacter dokdonensis]KGQ17890.1 Cation diffusion facilitator family transporter [Lysobacter dokdonensis DS-58]